VPNHQAAPLQFNTNTSLDAPLALAIDSVGCAKANVAAPSDFVRLFRVVIIISVKSGGPKEKRPSLVDKGLGQREDRLSVCALKASPEMSSQARTGFHTGHRPLWQPVLDHSISLVKKIKKARQHHTSAAVSGHPAGEPGR